MQKGGGKEAVLTWMVEHIFPCHAKTSLIHYLAPRNAMQCLLVAQSYLLLVCQYVFSLKSDFHKTT
jgi:hypothetical protein